MNLSEELLAEITARASTFDERLRNGYLIPHPERDEQEIDRRLERWRDRASKGDSGLFEEVLAMRGLDLESARKGLGRVKLAEGQALPEWAGILRECLAEVKNDDVRPLDLPHFCNKDEPLPFEQILAPFVQIAANRLREKTGPAYRRLEDKAHAAIERMLLTWLVGPCSSTLMLEFSIFRMQTRMEGARGDSKEENSSELYGEFAKKMLTGELANFLKEYSVLARAIATIIDHWTSAMAEFLERLDADWNHLEQVFQQDQKAQSVANIKAGLSDPHHGGRTVLALKFDSGVKVIYKPKPLDTEVAFGHLLDWVNERSTDLKLRSLRVLARPGYGWVEYLEHAPCQTEEQLTRFYRRGGMLLALFHVLDATDMHAENLIAVEEFPKLVDAETLITPQFMQSPQIGEQATAEIRALWNLNDSVIKTGMLPNWRRDAQKGDCDLSGLGGVGGEEIEAPVWVGAHTDEMERQISRVKVGRNQNVPFPPEQPAEPARFVEDVVAGFENVFHILMQNRDALLASHSPIELLARAPMRLVFRETQTYFNILKKSFDTAVLRDGADRSVDLEVLSRILCISQPRTKHLPLVEVERRSLENLDIPAFTTFPFNCSLNAGPERIVDNYFSESGYTRVLSRVRDLSPERWAEQVSVIRGSFYTKTLNQRKAAVSEPNVNSISSDELLAAAINIGERFQREAIRDTSGNASWVGVVYKPELEAFRYLPLAQDLFDGQAGIALFLAALAKVTGNAAFHELAAGAIAPSRRLIGFALDDSGWKKINDGKMESVLSILPLVRAAQLLDDPSLIELAGQAVPLVTPDLLAKNRWPGLPNGVAAILLGLLALRDASQDESALECAVLCGDYLLQKQEPIPGGAYAFRRLYEITREERFRAPGTERGTKAWIPGVLGTGLDLLSVAEALDGSSSAFLEASLLERCGSELMPLDAVLGGNFGLVELAVEAAEKLSRPQLLDVGKRLAAEAFRRAQKDGGYRIFSEVPTSAPCFGYLRGIAGIGYTLLRACAPEIRSILQWT